MIWHPKLGGPGISMICSRWIDSEASDSQCDQFWEHHKSKNISCSQRGWVKRLQRRASPSMKHWNLLQQKGVYLTILWSFFAIVRCWKDLERSTTWHFRQKCLVVLMFKARGSANILHAWASLLYRDGFGNPSRFGWRINRGESAIEEEETLEKHRCCSHSNPSC